MAPVQRICRFYKAIQKRFSEMVGCGKFVTCRGTCPLVERSDIVTLETIGKLWEFVRSLCAALFRVGNFNSLQSISVAVSVKLDPRAEQNQRSPASLALQFLPEGYREALAVLSRF